MKRLMALVLAAAMTLTMTSCGKRSDNSSKGNDGKDSIVRVDTSKEDDNELSVMAWDENFNVPALRAAEKAYQEVNPDFKLTIVRISESADVEDAITLAGSNNDYSKLSDIVLF